MHSGQCHCGAVKYQISGESLHSALCHCSDCRRHAGAPMVQWLMLPAEQVVIEGELAEYASSEYGRRKFCPKCGTSLFYENAQNLPGMIDVQAATLDDPDSAPPSAHIQMAESLAYMASVHELPKFDRFPAPPE